MAQVSDQHAAAQQLDALMRDVTITEHERHETLKRHIHDDLHAQFEEFRTLQRIKGVFALVDLKIDVFTNPLPVLAGKPHKPSLASRPGHSAGRWPPPCVPAPWSRSGGAI